MTRKPYTLITPYPPPTHFFRTPEEKTDQRRSWAREDTRFFAAGACHILAYTFYGLHPDEGYELIYTKPLGDHLGNHVYVRKNGWAFDFAGWTREAELLRVMREAYTQLYPDWKIKRTNITHIDLATFCKRYHHRPPAYYLHLPWKRAYAYIERCHPHPPEAA